MRTEKDTDLLASLILSGEMHTNHQVRQWARDWIAEHGKGESDVSQD